MREKASSTSPAESTDKPDEVKTLKELIESRLPRAELEKHNGQYVAWFPDGSGIYDSDPDPMALRERIKAAGDEVATYLIELISDEPQI